MQQFDKVKAIYNPQVTEDLKEYVKSHIGHEYEFEALWIIEEDDTGYGVKKRYVGQFAMSCDWLYGWIPEEDIEILSYLGGVTNSGLAMLHNDSIINKEQSDKIKKTFSEIDFNNLPDINKIEISIGIQSEEGIKKMKEKLLEDLIKLNPRR